MSIMDVIEIGRQGMNANRQGLQTTSTNIANANTPGYSRQRVELQANPSILDEGLRGGGGVDAKNVIRIHDGFVQNQIVDESKGLGGLKTRSDSLQRIEAIVTGEGQRMTDLLNQFFTDVRDLSTNPEMVTLRSNVAHSAEATAGGFRQMQSSLSEMRTSIDAQISSHVDEVNLRCKELASLNERIHIAEGRREQPNELYDRRDEIVRDLSQKLGVQAFPDETGQISIVAVGGGPIVTGNVSRELMVARTPAHDPKGAGSLDVCFKEGDQLHPISRNIDGGEIGGLLHVRDQVLEPTLQHLDQLAFDFSQAVNQAHREGVGSDGQGERNLFNELDGVSDAARLIDVNSDVKGRPEAIAVGMDAGAAGDNRIALKLAELQNAKLAPERMGSARAENGGLTTFNDSLTNLVGDIGIRAHNDNEAFQHQQAIVSQLDNYRQSVSGVSLDEEALNLMKFQSTFNACAKAMKVGDELMQTILSIKE